MLYRRRKSLDVSLWQELREPDQEPIVDEEPLPPPPPAGPIARICPPPGLQPGRRRPQEVSHV